MEESYVVEDTGEIKDLVRGNVEKYGRVGIQHVAGLSPADSVNPDRPREREEYLEKILGPMIASGDVADGSKGPYDDRKFRFHGAQELFSKERLDELVLELGITHYGECADCRKWDDKKRAKMIEEGQRRFNEPYAFFTKGCGMGVTPITADGSIFVGKREVPDEASGYSGQLAAVNGWVDYREDLGDVDFENDAIREMREEYGIREDEVDKLIFSGVFSAPNRADTDFVYIAQTRLPDTFFSEGEYKTRREDKEHEELIKIANFEDMQRLLETGELPGQEGKFDILYSLEASLRQIRPGEITSLTQ